MAEVRRVTRTEKSVRGPVGQVAKWLFILFNVLMLVWLVSSCAGMANVVSTAESEAEQAGAAIGSTLGVGMILFVWVCGDVILGLFALFTRGKKVIVEEVG